MDQQYGALSHKIDDLASKIDDLTTKVTNLQVQTGDGTVKFRVENAEAQINTLFSRIREFEKTADARRETVDERLQKIDSLVAAKISFWKGAAWLASGMSAVLLLLVDIALRLLK